MMAERNETKLDHCDECKDGAATYTATSQYKSGNYGYNLHCDKCHKLIRNAKARAKYTPRRRKDVNTDGLNPFLPSPCDNCEHLLTCRESCRNLEPVECEVV